MKSKEIANNVILKQWVNLYTDKLYIWAFYKLNNKELAEDLVQDTFMAALQAMDKFEGRSDPKTWLTSILNNKIAQHYRDQYRKNKIANTKEAPFLAHFFDEDGAWKPDERPEQWEENETHLLDNLSFIEVLKQCRKKLPEKWDAVMQLKYMDDKKGEMVCQELALTATNFWQILHRAKLQLRKCLTLNWFEQ